MYFFMPRKKNPSLVHQVVERLKSMDCRGQSRHKAKLEYRAQLAARGETMKGNRVPGKIFGEKTFDDYLDRCVNFAKWAREAFEVRNMVDIERDHVRIVNAYIDFLELDREHSAHTIHGYISGISMLLWTNNGDYDLPPRDYKKIKKNRIDPDAPREGFDHAAHSDLLHFTKATGLRRVELTKVHPAQVIKDKWGRVRIRVLKNQAKGGRPRWVDPIEEEAAWVYEFAKARQAEGKDRIFSQREGELPAAAPLHPCRAIFAERKYRELLVTHATKEVYRRRGDGRTFDRGALEELSQQMGHNRLGVCVQNYLWRPV